MSQFSNLVAAVLLVLTGSNAYAWQCNYDYESDGAKVATVILVEKINNTEGLVIKDRITGELIEAFAIDSTTKNRIGQIVIRASKTIEELDFQIGAVIIVPRILPGPGSVTYSSTYLDTGIVETSAPEEIFCQR